MAKQDILDAEAQVGEADADASRAAEKSDQAKEQVARAAVEVFELKINYLEESRFLRAKLKAQDDLIRVAEAKFELAKAKLAKNNNVRGAAEIQLPDFEAQVDSLGREREVHLSGPERLRGRGGRGEEAVARQAGPTDGGEWRWHRYPWAEDSGLWGRDDL